MTYCCELQTSPLLHGLPALPSLPPWLDAGIYAAHITHNIHRYYTPEAGVWGAQHASYSLAAATHYYSATGTHACPEMLVLRSMLYSKMGHAFTCGFLNSVAVLACPDLQTGQDIADMETKTMLARRWFGIRHPNYV